MYSAPAICLLTSVLLFAACDDNVEAVEELPVEMKQSTAPADVDIKPSFLSDLNFYWGNYKARNKYLLNCGKPVSGLWRDSAAGFHYSYCLFNGVAEKEFRKPDIPHKSELVQFIVWMKGKKAGFYSYSLNEQLVFIKCSYSDSRLQGFNLVGKNRDEITGMLGEPDSVGMSETRYFRNNELLTLKYNGNEVSNFTWLRRLK